MPPDCVEVVITAEDPEWASRWARSLVEQRLAACVHQVQEIRATYRWNGAVHDDPQVRLAVHTRAALVPAIVEKADREHADDVPCVIALPIAAGHPGYLQWICDETRDPAPG